MKTRIIKYPTLQLTSYWKRTLETLWKTSIRYCQKVSRWNAILSWSDYWQARNLCLLPVKEYDAFIILAWSNICGKHMVEKSLGFCFIFNTWFNSESLSEKKIPSRLTKLHPIYSNYENIWVMYVIICTSFSGLGQNKLHSESETPLNK